MSQVHERISARSTALIAAGSNATSSWGGPLETVQEGLARLAKAAGGESRISAFYRTPAFPAGAGPDFVNAAAAIETSIAPEDLLALLHRIEAKAQRTRDVRWGQRTLDLDLIAVGQSVMPDRPTFAHWRDLPLAEQMQDAPDRLILPHPRMQDRAFVLVPLSDVAPQWQHPVSGLTVDQMRDACAADELASVVRL
ncbi:2-amino-4-hydroxy-6-hydroxymethyldihydropteridine diphosphokinase [Yoonia sp. 208BN28-4]|uniref:2-amino-4-hydroxy-6- hydroxymethyldihydropteridine diphosphokinase n=1 Tax=Yoonia sp. 208BN28-4 TaxID=3126505 RepID=UPI0030AB6176